MFLGSLWGIPRILPFFGFSNSEPGPCSSTFTGPSPGTPLLGTKMPEDAASIAQRLSGPPPGHPGLAWKFPIGIILPTVLIWKFPIRMALQPLFRHPTVLIGNFISELLSSCFCMKISNQNGSAAPVAPPSQFDWKFPIRLAAVLFLH